MKLTLQPLIENAVYHGLENKRGIGNLTISIRKDSDFINIQIQDDGVGIPPGRLSQLADSRLLLLETGSSHIGICNVYKRLKLRFGDSCGLKVDSNRL